MDFQLSGEKSSIIGMNDFPSDIWKRWCNYEKFTLMIPNLDIPYAHKAILLGRPVIRF